MRFLDTLSWGVYAACVVGLTGMVIRNAVVALL